ncbi:precorrin-6A synthase CbiD [Clostridium aceticum]|uniref:Cobalt-precorrin-5B C(1)-methyltransferase n=1 Tax=Clostridium aceticum TaxID=84022 RepID=A0A0D8IA72_9CLOT|nr:cobalt-precorrin-5B (C(1))-methyltransferase CbiD [Clostridium aceticum]AKL93576.1 precorrin-6A synthase CbiD [Clostridium aceticum]KJF27168.1 cobalt-precorrin-6A synthase [Clostridium aceticum]
MEKYVVKNGKKLRYGYTTGSCAAAAAKAAAQMLLEGRDLESISISTPKGWDLNLTVLEKKRDNEGVSCGIKKDGGDDPDATNGLVIYSRVKWRKDTKINIDGGIGVGRVTKKGLPIPVGKAAINPIPLQMIEKEIRQVIGENKGVDVEIFIPKGEEIAVKTFNPRLGIIGGISILGTSGIVEPMSEEAWKESLALEISVAKEEGLEKLIFVPGNYGRDLIKNNYDFDEKYVIKTSNFIGFMLDQAMHHNIKKILLVGHIGKLIKVAGGIFHTHSKIADGRREILAAYLGILGASPLEIKSVLESNTTEEAVTLIQGMKKEEIFSLLAEKITEKALERTFKEVEIGTIIFSMEHGVLATCEEGKKLLEEFKR